MTKYKLQVTGNFKQDVKRCKKRGLPLQELWDVVEMLLCGETLPVKFHGIAILSPNYSSTKAKILK